MALVAVLLMALATGNAAYAGSGSAHGRVITSPPNAKDHPFVAMKTQAADLRPATRQARQHIGVASMNVDDLLSHTRSLQDAQRLTARSDVDLVGWQEANRDRSVYQALTKRGWSTRFFNHGANELATSWRRSKFGYVSSSEYKMHVGADARSTAHPFPARWVTRVTLRDKATGHRLTLLNTHLNQRIENPDRPGHYLDNLNATRAKKHLRKMRPMWAGSPGRYVIGTGDYNFDAAAEERVRPDGGLSMRFQGKAATSYHVLGLQGVDPTNPDTGRRIDYVLASRRTLDQGFERFVSQRALQGYHSDHRPLLVRLALF